MWYCWIIILAHSTWWELLAEPKCTEFWSKKVPDLSQLGPIWPTLELNLTSLYKPTTEEDIEAHLTCETHRMSGPTRHRRNLYIFISIYVKCTLGLRLDVYGLVIICPWHATIFVKVKCRSAELTTFIPAPGVEVTAFW